MADRLKLTAVSAKALGPGFHSDGGGLYLAVSATGAGRAWKFRFRDGARLRDYGLGPFADVSLKEARIEADKLRKLRRDGVDPIEHRRQREAARRLADASAVTFKQAAKAYIEANRAGWRNAKHAAQWAATLETYAHPVIGALPVAAVETGHLVTILQPIWAAKNETASRVRGRIEAVLDFATVRHWRTGDNPARWRGHLAQVLPPRAKVGKGGHHAALPYADIPAFMGALAGQAGIAALALRFAILTAARTGEVLGATWGEFDLAAAIWTVPASRMKGRREHRVPLSGAALAVLREMRMEPATVATSATVGGLETASTPATLATATVPAHPVFPGARRAKPLSGMALLMLLRRMGRGELTAHGFRSSFRDWSSESTDVPGEVCEAALAHTIRSKVEAAYRRGDLFDKRRALMDAWATFCEGGE